jgi:putative endonuclease
MSRGGLGKWGESLACQRLRHGGYRILERNWRVREGELDIVAEREGEIVFVEVKTRRSEQFGPPEESFTPTKRGRLLAAALAYLEQHGLTNRAWRVDLVAIQMDGRGGMVRYDHYQNVLEGGGPLTL